MLITLPNAFGDAATNMAIDTALLESIPEGLCGFRHYAWTEPTFSFGYSQHYRDVRPVIPGGPVLCRRMTGGGIVDHRDDWTYALILSRALDPAELPAAQLYEQIHRALATALEEQGQKTALAPCPRRCEERTHAPDGPEQCFLQPVMHDVLTEKGRKIAGAAMKRSRRALLVQGSIARTELPDNFDYQIFAKEFSQRLALGFGLRIGQPEDLRPFFPSHRIAREKERFQSAAWTERR